MIQSPRIFMSQRHCLFAVWICRLYGFWILIVNHADLAIDRREPGSEGLADKPQTGRPAKAMEAYYQKLGIA